MSMEEEDADVYRIEVAYVDEDDKPLNLSLSTKRSMPDQADVKQTLKSMIRARRIAEGKGDLDFDLSQDTDSKSRPQLTLEELAKQKDRKEQNRKAAMRCREKKKLHQLSMKEELDKLRKKNKELRTIYKKLRAEKNALIETIKHREPCCLPENTDSLVNSELPDQAVPVSAASLNLRTKSTLLHIGAPHESNYNHVSAYSENDSNNHSYYHSRESSNSASNNLSDSDEENLVIVLSSSDEDSQDSENEALDLRVQNVQNNLPRTFTPEVSDDESEDMTSKKDKGTQYDSDYPSSSLESDVHTSDYPSSSFESDVHTSDYPSSSFESDIYMSSQEG